jgi:hypothetical protein
MCLLTYSRTPFGSHLNKIALQTGPVLRTYKNDLGALYYYKRYRCYAPVGGGIGALHGFFHVKNC